MLLLAALAGEHILYIGPPGTAKSELGRRLCRLCAGGATYFERLLTRFSVPEELFGPLSMRALEEDKYVRQTQARGVGWVGVVCVCVCCGGGGGGGVGGGRWRSRARALLKGPSPAAETPP